MTSFQRSHGLTMPVFSAAVYQPKGYELPKADWTDIRRDGRWIRPRDFVTESGVYVGDPLESYARALFELYDSRIEEAQRWFHEVAQDYHTLGGIALACWCPYDRAAQRQLGEHGSFVCHTGPLGSWIESRLGHRVWNDTDRARMKAIV